MRDSEVKNRILQSLRITKNFSDCIILFAKFQNKRLLTTESRMISSDSTLTHISYAQKLS